MYTRTSDDEPRPPENYSGTFIDKSCGNFEEECRPEPLPECPDKPPMRPNEPPREPCEKGGILGRLGNLSSDDILLFGIIYIIFTNSKAGGKNCDNSDDILLILGLLLIIGL